MNLKIFCQQFVHLTMLTVQIGKPNVVTQFLVAVDP